jgi:hypothetical protein
VTARVYGKMKRKRGADAGDFFGKGDVGRGLGLGGEGVDRAAEGEAMCEEENGQRREAMLKGGARCQSENGAAAYPFGVSSGLAVGQKLTWAGSVPRGLFYLFFVLLFYLFLFSCFIFCKKAPNQFKQVPKFF